MQGVYIILHCGIPLTELPFSDVLVKSFYSDICCPKRTVSGIMFLTDVVYGFHLWFYSSIFGGSVFILSVNCNLLWEALDLVIHGLEII